MNLEECKMLLKETRKICIFGAGYFGRGDGFQFIKQLLTPEKRVSYFCDNNLQPGVKVTEGIETVSPEFLYKNKNDVACVITGNCLMQREVLAQLTKMGLERLYMLSEADIYTIYKKAYNDKYLSNKLESFFCNKSYELQIETSSFCNAKCNFCSNPTLRREKCVMSNEVFEKVLERVKEEKINISKFILCLNGEPLTDKLLFDRIRKIKVEFPDSNVEFTSNFALANDRIIEEILTCGMDRIICSINAINPQEYEEIMKLEYENTITNLLKLIQCKKEKESKLNICISIVRNSKNASEVERFCEFWQKKDVQVRILEMGNWINHEYCDGMEPRSREGICSILYRTINILSNGDYALCCFDSEGLIRKNVMDYSIGDAWRDKIFQDIREWHLVNGKTNCECINCSF